jgi:hypothetical protein
VIVEPLEVVDQRRPLGMHQFPHICHVFSSARLTASDR